MSNDRCLLSTRISMYSTVIDRLFHGVEHVEVLHSFDLEVEARQFGTDDIGIPRGTAILLTPERFEESCLAEHIAP